MGKMSKEQIYAFSQELVEKICEINLFFFEDEDVRFSDYSISLGQLAKFEEAKYYGDEKEVEFLREWHQDGIHKVEKKYKLKNVISRAAEDEDIEAVIFCEGKLYEMLYYYEGYGSGDEKAKKIYDAFLRTTEKHNLWYEWGSGIIYLYGASE